MNLQKLRAFRAVMLTGSVTQAAERLSLTQPAVSRSILALSEELGFKLFSRHRGRLVPTRQGEAFYKASERVLAGVDDLSRIAKDIRRNKTAPLKVLSMPQLTRGPLPTAVAEFIREMPDSPVTVEIKQRVQVAQRLLVSPFDIALVSIPFELPGFWIEPFASINAVAVVPRDHVLARKSKIALSDLEGQPLVLDDRGSLLRPAIDNAFFLQGLMPNVVLETSSAFVSGHLAVQGVGISIVDPFTASVLPSDKVVLMRWDEAPKLVYGFVFSRDAMPVPKVPDRFADLVTEATRQLLERYPVFEGQAIRSK